MVERVDGILSDARHFGDEHLPQIEVTTRPGHVVGDVVTQLRGTADATRLTAVVRRPVTAPRSCPAYAGPV